ncbi:hypothetical protein P6144_11610 [Sphingomonas sp. HITSZ_GF]|uniref:hypothetical protein n=1 Tax=Sphingomonas sp. HITSZ_GF TaxID=3037247 RepID=UPI00240D5033|nr:hypothetical protein [Sphingomonas sp. HITSZ_GF]MDG2534298.1 hypothetical protein [Sphingomonas sp. HITSZ_GF]
MPRWLTLLLCLFWMPVLVLSAWSLVRDGFYPDLYYLIGIPLGMIALTLFVGRFATGYPRQGLMLSAATAVSFYAVYQLFWIFALSV